MLAFTIELFAIVGFASLSDRIGRRPVYLFGALCGVAFAFPFFWLVGTKEWIWIAAAFIIARAVVTAAMFGPQAAYFAELFPPQRRFAGFAFARETGSLLAGGPAPFLAAYLVSVTGSWWPVACYAALLSGLTARRTSPPTRCRMRRSIRPSCRRGHKSPWHSNCASRSAA
jgi:MFS family permease